ncbi:MAG: glycosyltransferase family 4 protein [Clostridia bacterium]|nr:glycosyltransferase family 4 protein [Clostridia bacterium]
MRIVILANADIGLYKFRRELIERLVREHEVTALIPCGEFTQALRGLGLRVEEFEFNRRGTDPLADIRQLMRYKRALKRLAPDAVLTYTVKPNIYGGMAARSLKIPFLANVTGLGTALENGGPLSHITRFLYKRGLRGARRVFFQNRSNMEAFRSLGIFRGECTLLPGSGVNTQEYAFSPYPDGPGTRFLFVGRLMRDKGIYELLEAVQRLHAEDPSVTCDIVGWSEEGEIPGLDEAVRSGAVRMHGRQPGALEYYRACSCAVLPSYHEGMANVNLEASSCGRPVITTDVPGCRETADDGVTGFIIPAGDAEALYKAMRRFSKLSAAERARMGAAAREKAVREFDRAAVVEAYMRELDSLKAGRGPEGV